VGSAPNQAGRLTPRIRTTARADHPAPEADMDPSAAPWRVLEAADPPSQPGVASPSTVTPSTPALPVSPLTAAAGLGIAVLAIAAFVFAATDAGGGTVQVAGDTSLAPIPGVGGDTGSDGAGVQGSNVLVVEIAGAVRAPGVFRLPAGSRIGDLVEAAGGFGPRLDAARATLDLNLAARLADGDRVVVPSRDDMASSTSGTAGGAADGG